MTLKMRYLGVAQCLLIPMIPFLKKTLPPPTASLAQNPFADLKAAHERVVKEEEAMPYQDRVKDWLHVKPSSHGSASRKRKVILLLPVSGSSIVV